MEIQEILNPVPWELREKINEDNPFLIGNKIRFEIDDDFSSDSIVLFSLEEYQSRKQNTAENAFFPQVRAHFYNLYPSNWKRNLYDLGTLFPGETFDQTCFALQNTIRQLSERKNTVVCFGGTQALSYIIYEGIQKKYINVATIDIKLDLAAAHQELNHRNFVTKMILNEHQKLLEYVNLASQAPYNSIEEFDVLEQLNFENIRLGKLTENLSLAEPLLREMDFVSVDLSAMQQTAMQSAIQPTPNGLTEREICGIMRYCGLSESIKNLHLSNAMLDNPKDSALVSEMLWYFIEAQNNQKNDGNLETYRVQFDEQEVLFFKSKNSERWWVQVEEEEHIKRIPCNEEDYHKTLRGEIPDKWFRFFKKFY